MRLRVKYSRMSRVTQLTLTLIHNYHDVDIACKQAPSNQRLLRVLLLIADAY